MIGKLLSDGNIRKQKGRKPPFVFKHITSEYGWTLHCYKKLKSTVPLNKPVFQKAIDHRLVKGYSTLYYVQSKTCEILTYLYKKWYPNGKKIVPIESLHKYFNDVSLAWWYMDDGHLKITKGTPRKIILSSECFTDKEITLLQKLLKE